MTVAAPPNPTHTPQQRPGRSWPWALGALLVVALVWGGSYAGHQIVAARNLAAARVPAPTYPPAPITSVLRPEAGATLVAALGASGRMVLLAGPREPACPPTGACPATPPLDRLLVVDAHAGATLAQAPLTGASTQPVALAVEASRALADVISASAVDVYATDTGAHLGAFALPAGVTAHAGTCALITADGALIMMAQVAQRPALVAVDAQSGAARFTVAFADATAPQELAYDPGTGFLALVITTPGHAGLRTFNSANGEARGDWALPPGVRLGPVDAASHTLYVFEPDGATASLAESALTPGPPPGANAPLTPQPALAHVHALGWNHTLGHTYLADAAGLRILDSATGRTLAALPLPVALAPDVALPGDAANNLVIAPTDHGALAIIQDNTTPGAHGVTPATAALLARAAVAVLPPQSGGSPPFLTPATFTVGPGSRALDFYAYDPDFGTNGPYPGTATLALAPVSGQPNAFDATFTVTWNLRFLHTRTWVYRVAPDGGVRLVSQSGDSLPCCQNAGQTSG